MDARQLLCEALVACTRGIMGEGGGDCLFNLCLEINTVVLFILEKMRYYMPRCLFSEILCLTSMKWNCQLYSKCF